MKKTKVINIEEYRKKKEQERREESIKRLLKKAHKMKW
jgi:hypothetical protein